MRLAVCQQRPFAVSYVAGVSSIHLHNAPRGANGPVILDVVQDAGGDINGLLDQRQVLIDQVNQLVPVNVVARDNNRVSLYSDGGLILLEGSAAEFAFSVTGNTKQNTGINVFTTILRW